MYDRILLPIDGSAGATGMIDHVADIAAEQDARVTALFVADTNRDSVTRVRGEVVDAFLDTGEEIVGEAANRLATRGIDVDTDVIQGGPARTITEYAQRYDYDLIALPTHSGDSLSRRLLGSVTERVLQLSPCPIVTLRMDGETRTAFPYERLLLATDGSAAARTAMGHGLDLAAALDATPHVVSVVEDRSFPSLGGGSDLEAAARSAVDEVAAMAAERGIDDVVTVVEDGSPRDVLCSYADAETDAIVLGTTGRRGIERLLLGTVAELVIRSAPVPVLSVPQ